VTFAGFILLWRRANAGTAYANAYHVYAACVAMGSNIMHKSCNCSRSFKNFLSKFTLILLRERQRE